MKKLFYESKDKFFLLEEDTVGWYLIVYKDRSMKSSIEDHLLDNYDYAIKVAKEDFHISEKNWKSVV